MSTEMKQYILLENISKTYDKNNNAPNDSDKTQILNIEEIKIPLGEFVAILGYSGSGKSTLMNILSLLDIPDLKHITTGRLPKITYYLLNETIEITYEQCSDPESCSPSSSNITVTVEQKNGEREILKACALRSNYFSYIFQHAYLHPNFDVEDNIKAPLVISDRKSGLNIDELIASAGLEGQKKRYINDLSGGEQQRTAILRGLVKQVPVIIGDELTNNLDQDRARQLMGLFKNQVESGRSFLWVTHDIHLAAEYSDYIVTIKNGRVEVLKNPGNETDVLNLLRNGVEDNKRKTISLPEPEQNTMSFLESTRFYFVYAFHDLFRKATLKIGRKRINIYKFTTDYTVSLLSVTLVMLFLLSLSKMGFTTQQFMSLKLSDPRINNLRLELNHENAETDLYPEDKEFISKEMHNKGYEVSEISPIYTAIVSLVYQHNQKKKIDIPRTAFTFEANDSIINQLLSKQYDIDKEAAFINSTVDARGIIVYERTLRRYWNKVMKSEPPVTFPKSLKMLVSINGIKEKVQVLVTDKPLPGDRNVMLRREYFIDAYHAGNNAERDPFIDHFLIYPKDIQYTKKIVELFAQEASDGRTFDVDSALNVVQKIDTINDIKTLVNGVVQWSLFAILLLSVSFITLTLYRNINRKKQEIGVFLAFGMKRRSFVLFYFIESLILWVSSTMITLALFYAYVDSRINEIVMQHSPVDMTLPEALRVNIAPDQLSLPSSILIGHFGASFILLCIIFIGLILKTTSRLPVKLLKD
jgi:putative ABC transport system ATP-binding protein